MKRTNAVRKYLTKDKLYFHLIVQNLTQKQLANQCGVSQELIRTIIKEYKLNKKEERKKYVQELNKKIQEKNMKVKARSSKLRKGYVC